METANTRTETLEVEVGTTAGSAATDSGTAIDAQADLVIAGSILIEQSAHLSASLLHHDPAYPGGWAALKSPRSISEKDIEAAGLTFFFMAGEIQTSVFGSDRQKTLGEALRRLVAQVKSQDCNGIEVTQVKYKSFLKLPYVSVRAHPRHLQRGLIFRDR